MYKYRKRATGILDPSKLSPSSSSSSLSSAATATIINTSTNKNTTLPYRFQFSSVGGSGKQNSFHNKNRKNNNNHSYNYNNDDNILRNKRKNNHHNSSSSSSSSIICSNSDSSKFSGHLFFMFLFIILSVFAHVGIRQMQDKNIRRSWTEKNELLSQEVESSLEYTKELQKQLSIVRKEAFSTKRDHHKSYKQMKTLKDYKIKTQQNIQEYSKRLLIRKYGVGPHYVEIRIHFIDKQQPSSSFSDSFLIEMAPIDEMPHSVYWFLEQVSNQLYNDFSFTINELRNNQGVVLLQSTEPTRPITTNTNSNTNSNSYSDQSDASEVVLDNNNSENLRVLKRFEEKGLANLLFPEYSTTFTSNIPYTLGYRYYDSAISNGGQRVVENRKEDVPNLFYVAIQQYNNNNDDKKIQLNESVVNSVQSSTDPSSSPSSIGNENEVKDTNSCFAKVVKGFDVVDRIQKYVNEGGSNNDGNVQHPHIFIQQMRII